MMTIKDFITLGQVTELTFDGDMAIKHEEIMELRSRTKIKYLLKK